MAMDIRKVKKLMELLEKSGMAEIIKYGLTYDLKLFNHIKEYKGLHISDLIFRSIQIKNEIVYNLNIFGKRRDLVKGLGFFTHPLVYIYICNTFFLREKHV